MIRSLSDTSALVLLWAQGEIHTCGNSRAFLESLDLGPGMELLEKCNGVWPHYGQVILNRKKCILDLARHAVCSDKITQVVIFGAGMDALSVELASSGPEGLRVFDVDYAGMQEKGRLIRAVDPALAGRIICINADLKEPEKAYGLLQKHGWDGSRPSALVLEGISYYLGEVDLADLIGMFRTGRNRVLLEYLLHDRCISKERAGIPTGVFGAISGPRGIRPVRYDAAGVRRALGPAGNAVRVHDLRDMERSRLGRNVHFKGKRSGWIQVCEFVI